jgi:hypothetical protein
MEFLDFTSVTLDEFQQLPAFCAMKGGVQRS